MERFARYGRIYKTHLLGSPTVRVTGADYIWPLMSKEPYLLSMKIPASTRYLFGKQSVAATTGQEHFVLKKKLMTSVSPVRYVYWNLSDNTSVLNTLCISESF